MKRPYILWGAFARFACAPFLLQWFHPDERQMLEFAHFHAHGRLHPFMESSVHLRNQTLPVLFSWVLRFCDAIGFPQPWAYLTALHWIIGGISWLAFVALVEDFRKRYPEQDSVADRLGWFFALFWAFPFLYSRQLLEAVSLPPTLLLLIAVRNKRFKSAGIWAGVTSFLRYPSALWAVGAFLVGIRQQIRSRAPLAQPFAWAFAGALGAIAVGGWADWVVYGEFLGSARHYWEFNHPGGPVHQLFGDDSLVVYWRWFEFLFTPWGAPIFVGLGLFALVRVPELLLFCAPYILGHLWTPHREPRFLLPLTPILCLAIAEAYGLGKFDPIRRAYLKVPRFVVPLGMSLAALHFTLNFAWYPLNAWAQLKSAQGVLIRSHGVISREPHPLLAMGDPAIDALIPTSVRWADSNCHWHRPTRALPEDTEAWVIREEGGAGCHSVLGQDLPELRTGPWTRLLRVRTAHLWKCPWPYTARMLCPEGFTENNAQEPFFGADLKSTP